VILIENDKMNIKQYKEVPSPFHLPNDMDLFKWSVPFLMEKVSDMFVHIVKQNAKLDIKDEEIDKVDLKTLLEE
jgi:serine/threonine-protein phosphatase 2B catalytic subunit